MAKKKYYQRKDGLFEAIRVINGKRVAFRGHSCREVDQKMLAYKETASTGRAFPVIADAWAAEHAKTVKESSMGAYLGHVKALKEAFPGPVSEINPLDVKRHINDMERKNYAGRTVEKRLGTMKLICAYAVLMGDIDVSPAREVHKSKGLPRKEREALTEEQEEIVRTSLDAPFGLFPFLLLYTGLRRGEALALTYADVDRKAGVIHITKKVSQSFSPPRLENWTKSENGIRDVPLLKPLADALPKNHIGLIFPGPNGGYMSEYWLTKYWREYCRAVGFVEVSETDDGETMEEFPVTPHCLRHSFATICYEAGLDVRQAAKICGDTPEIVERIYTHLRQKQAASAAEKLSAYFGGHCVESV